MFDNFKLSKDGCIGYETRSSTEKNVSIFNIAIYSKKAISKEEIEKILKDKHIQPKSKEIEKRLNNYLSKQER